MARWGALGTGLGLLRWLEEQDAALARLVATLGPFRAAGKPGLPWRASWPAMRPPVTAGDRGAGRRPPGTAGLLARVMQCI